MQDRTPKPEALALARRPVCEWTRPDWIAFHRHEHDVIERMSDGAFDGLLAALDDQGVRALLDDLDVRRGRRSVRSRHRVETPSRAV